MARLHVEGVADRSRAEERLARVMNADATEVEVPSKFR